MVLERPRFSARKEYLGESVEWKIDTILYGIQESIRRLEEAFLGERRCREATRWKAMQNGAEFRSCEKIQRISVEKREPLVSKSSLIKADR